MNNNPFSLFIGGKSNKISQRELVELEKRKQGMEWKTRAEIIKEVNDAEEIEWKKIKKLYKKIMLWTLIGVLIFVAIFGIVTYLIWLFSGIITGDWQQIG